MADFDSNFYDTTQLHIQQKFEGLELLGLKNHNHYAIYDQSWRLLAYAMEQGKGFLYHFNLLFLKHWRPFDIFIFNQNQELVIKVHHSFRWFFKRLELFSSDSKRVGFIEQKFGFFNRFKILDKNGDILFQISISSLFVFSGWTFEIKRPFGKTIAKVEKKQGQPLHELFTNQDHFLLSFDQPIKPHHRQLLLVAVLLIDLVYVEDNG